MGGCYRETWRPGERPRRRRCGGAPAAVRASCNSYASRTDPTNRRTAGVGKKKPRKTNMRKNHTSQSPASNHSTRANNRPRRDSPPPTAHAGPFEPGTGHAGANNRPRRTGRARDRPRRSQQQVTQGQPMQDRSSQGQATQEPTTEPTRRLSVKQRQEEERREEGRCEKVLSGRAASPGLGRSPSNAARATGGS